MMQNPLKNMVMPALIGAAVLAVALSLLTIVARGPYTHANLDLGFDPRYTRTIQMLVGAPLPLEGMAPAKPASDQIQFGKQLFVTEGCAACHGLDGGGGIIGPSIQGTKAAKLRVATTVGPKGMPPYATGALSDQDLAAIAAFLNATAK